MDNFEKKRIRKLISYTCELRIVYASNKTENIMGIEYVITKLIFILISH